MAIFKTSTLAMNILLKHKADLCVQDKVKMNQFNSISRLLFKAGRTPLNFAISNNCNTKGWLVQVVLIFQIR